MQKKTHQSVLIFYGLILGLIFGFVLNHWVEPSLRAQIITYITAPIGTVFLRSLFMVVVPLVFTSIAVGIIGLGEASELKRMGGRILSYYFLTTLIAVLIGQSLALSIGPGEGLDKTYVESVRADLNTQVSSLQTKSSGVASSLWPGLVSTIIPKNIIEDFAAGNMLAIIFVALIFGGALLSVPLNYKNSLENAFKGITEACVVIIGWIMKLAPLAVAALITNAVATFDFYILKNIGLFFVTVVLGYGIHLFVVYGLIIKFVLKKTIFDFYKRFSPAMLTAFSTSSSNATIPMTIKTLSDRFGVTDKVAHFTIPLGATVNMDGTALFEMVTAIFVAQVFGVELTITSHIALIIIVILTSVGVAGIPGGSIPLLMSAMAFVGIPAEGIALVLGVDRFLDMGRTVVNVTGDAVGALLVSKFENKNWDWKKVEE